MTYYFQPPLNESYFYLNSAVKTITMNVSEWYAYQHQFVDMELKAGFIGIALGLIVGFIFGALYGYNYYKRKIRDDPDEP